MYTTLSETTKINNKYCGNSKSNAASESLWEFYYYQGLMGNSNHKEGIIGNMFPEVLQSRPRGTISQQLTIWYPIDRRRCILNMIYKIYPL